MTEGREMRDEGRGFVSVSRFQFGGGLAYI